MKRNNNIIVNIFKTKYNRIRTYIKLNKVITTLLLFIILHLISFAQDSVLINAIEENDYELLEEWVKNNDVNGYYGEKACTPLVISIHKNKPDLVKLFLDNGVDTEKLCNNKTPLIHAVDSGNLKMIKVLLRKGADINGTSTKENNALIYASYYGYLDIARYLVRRGINYNHYNSAGKTALDYANTSHRYAVAKYLRSINAESEETFLPDFLDGPYVWWQDNTNGTVVYLKRDSSKNVTTLERKPISRRGNPVSFDGFAGDTNSYKIYTNKPDRKNTYRNVDRIFAMGDIHGGYFELIEVMKNFGVINNDLKWNWGKGHLVFLGDLFDRGDNVTEVLWLIYRLEHEAKKAGGKVHVLLGNHELMIMQGNTRDMPNKYKYLSGYLGFDLSQFYGLDFEFGKWLRSKKTLLKINDYLFVHGGISPELLHTNYNMHDINNLVFKYLNVGLDSTEVQNSRFILGTKGPFWYRGYFGDWNDYDEISEEEVDETLRFFNVSKIIVGHTNVKEVTSFYNDKIYATDIPYYVSDEIVLQGLLIEDEAFYRVTSDGNKIKME